MIIGLLTSRFAKYNAEKNTSLVVFEVCVESRPANHQNPQINLQFTKATLFLGASVKERIKLCK